MLSNPASASILRLTHASVLFSTAVFKIQCPFMVRYAPPLGQKSIPEKKLEIQHAYPELLQLIPIK